MAWYSILPPQLEFIERWVIRICLVLAIINLAPWVIAILYDLLLYIGRRLWHEMPIWGGRARGDARPRAPSLRDRPRRFSLVELMGGGDGGSGSKEEMSVDELRRRHKTHVRNTSAASVGIEEEPFEALR
ncbi:uncharacterized protein HMPREF1541_01245 [Cyphellophora europaea CBS 101466]|uniref:Uncharacterized protein n=1 Tax=Cyphellophora europaea (strain CBS 101466) TaxID=1220924 RepID=W2SEK3_CYPE1|nr:uncharacterized protein HMPREF1541_01245 [Cyphellophora europaea CBS 101466]ETN47055.1 hypothetical protein HMPREF1541_01245 [Cyphellophora europaea CBS 101466]